MLQSPSQLADLQAFMRAAPRSIDAWVVYDFRGSSGVLPRLLPAPLPLEGASGREGIARRWTTRRVFALIPSVGEPRLLVHAIDESQFKDISPQTGITKDIYLAWPEIGAWLSGVLDSCGRRIAMDYSPGNALPVVSQVDAGTVDLVRGLGGEVVSSADLIQHAIARWDAAAVESHTRASNATTRIMADAWSLIRSRLASGKVVNERDVQVFILEQFAQAGLTAGPDAPVVAVNAHAADPHFEVMQTGSAVISKGDWILIDLWAREKVGDGAPGAPAQDAKIYSDITWTGFAGKPGELAPRRREVFDAVRDARDASIALAQSAHARGVTAQGWQLDDAARQILIARGLAPFIRHRTGHSLSPGPMVHGMGFNLDNLETRDVRAVIPGVGWTVEPGAYLSPGSPGIGTTESFGVRNEINMWYHPQRGPIVTSCQQDEPVWLM